MDIEKILQANQALISGKKRAKFEHFRSLLLEYNQKYNLTSITEERDVFYKHFLDSSAGTGLFQEGASVAEVGSGGGISVRGFEAAQRGFILYFIGKRGKKVRVFARRCG